MGARQSTRPGNARFPDRSVERSRRIPAQSHRSRHAPKGNSLFEPHPAGDQPVQEKADPPARSGPAPCQNPKGITADAGSGNAGLGSGREVYNLIQLIYRAKNHEGNSKDYEFSRRTMEEHWRSGYNDAVRTLRHPEVLQRPQGLDGVFTFDLAVDGRA